MSKRALLLCGVLLYACALAGVYWVITLGTMLLMCDSFHGFDSSALRLAAPEPVSLSREDRIDPHPHSATTESSTSK